VVQKHSFTNPKEYVWFDAQFEWNGGFATVGLNDYYAQRVPDADCSKPELNVTTQVGTVTVRESAREKERAAPERLDLPFCEELRQGFLCNSTSGLDLTLTSNTALAWKITTTNGHVCLLQDTVVPQNWNTIQINTRQAK
jgi:hypothetical protein